MVPKAMKLAPGSASSYSTLASEAGGFSSGTIRTGGE